MNLQRRAIRGVFGYGSVNIVRFALSFGVQIAFARLLAPSAFGIIALSSSILTGLTLLGRWGISEALMQDTDHEHLFSTVFWLRAGYSLLILVFIGAFAVVAQRYYETIILRALLALAVGKSISSLATPFQAIMEREFKLLQLAVLDILALVLGTVFGLWMIFDGFGVWGLIAYYMLYDALYGVVVVGASPQYPTVAFNRTAARWFLDFAWSLLFSKSLSAVESRADDFLIGTLSGSTVLGIYTISYRLTEAFSTVFQTTIRKGILPTFSHIQDADEKSKKGLAFLLRMQTYAVVPLYIFVAITATEIVTLFFGSQWISAGPVLQALAPAGIFIPLVASMRQYYYSVGRGHLVLRIQILYLAVFVVSLVALIPPFGALGGAAATVAAQVLGFGLFSYSLRSDVRLTLRPVYAPATKAGFPTVLAVVGLYVWGFPPQRWLDIAVIPVSELLVPLLVYGVTTVILFYPLLYATNPSIVRGDGAIVWKALTD